MTARSDLSVNQEKASSPIIHQVDVFHAWMRLTGMELYKIFKRTMSKALLGAGLVINIVVLLAIGFSTWSDVNKPAAAFNPPLCSESTNTPGCLNHLPTLTDRQQYKQQEIDNNEKLLALPGSLQLVFLISVNVLVLLVILLAGTSVGSEYTLGTIRLLYTRGPSRLQFLWAKIRAIAVCIITGILLFAGVTIVLGYAMHPLSQLPVDFRFFNVHWLGDAGLFLLACMVNWFAFAMMALFFATLGRSNVAGIVGPFVWLFAEEILTRLLFSLAGPNSGPLGEILRAIPAYFVGNAASTLIQNQGVIVFQGTNGLTSSFQAGWTVAAYLVVFIGLSSWLITHRDVQS